MWPIDTRIQEDVLIMNRQWDIPTFLFSYAMCGVFPLIFVGWKVMKRIKWLRPEEVQLRPVELAGIDEYTRNYIERKPKTRMHAWVDKIFG